MQRGLLHPVYLPTLPPATSSATPLVIKSTLNSFLLLSPEFSLPVEVVEVRGRLLRPSHFSLSPPPLSLSRSRSYSAPPLGPSPLLVFSSLSLFVYHALGVRLASNQSSFSLLRRFRVIKPFNAPLDYRMEAPVMLCISDVFKFFIFSALLQMRYFTKF